MWLVENRSRVRTLRDVLTYNTCHVKKVTILKLNVKSQFSWPNNLLANVDQVWNGTGNLLSCSRAEISEEFYVLDFDIR